MRLDRRERAGFLGNLAALLDASLVHGSDYLRLVGAFASDPDPLVVSAVITALEGVKTPLITPESRAAFATYVRRTLGPALERIGPAARPGEPESASTLRPRLIWWLGAYGDDPRVRAYAAELTRAYLQDPSRVDPALAGAALDVTAATAGDRALFDQIRKRIEVAKLPGERAVLFGALGQFRDPALLEEALNLPGRTFQEGAVLTRAMSSTAEGSERVFAWYKKNYDEVASRLPPMFLAFLPNSALGPACSEDRLAAVTEFFGDPRRNVAGTDKELAMRSEAVRDCIALRAREAPSTASYLHRLDPSSR
jgi:alanyl aminopeptidase